MTTEILECEEFSEVRVRVSALMRDGELTVDPRISSKGYLTATFKEGQLVLRTTKFVGLIPLTSDVSVRVKPRATISNLAYMLTRSQKAPTAISGFSRGYSSRFVRADNVERLFGPTLISSSAAIARRGLVKRYERPDITAPWRGRFLASDTVRKHASKGVHFRHEFEQSVLTPATLDNFAIQEALKRVVGWYQINDRKSPLLTDARKALSLFRNVGEYTAGSAELSRHLKKMLSNKFNIRQDYADALWAAYAILEQSIPDVGQNGEFKLDSLIVDVSEIFEAYLRRELASQLGSKGYKVQDGWKRPHPFFADGGAYSVHPDMIIRKDDRVVAILDAKYKPDVSEQDRYEVLSFMDVMKIDVGGFVCPSQGVDGSRLMGVTASGKRLHNFRFDLAADDPAQEARKFAENVERMIGGRQDFL